MKLLHGLTICLGLFCGGNAAFAAGLKDLTLSSSTQSTLKNARAKEKTPYDVKQWIDAVLKGDNEGAAHLWGHIQNQMPKDIRQEANAAFLVQLARLDLNQTFVDQLITFLGQKNFTRSGAWKELKVQLQPQLASTLMDEAISIRPEQMNVVERMPDDELSRAMKVWGNRDQLTTNGLKMLPEDHVMRSFFVPKRVNYLAHNSQVDQAIDLVEEELSSPNLSDDVKGMYNLLLARLYFQTADLDKAEAAYLAVGEKTPSINEAREEILWVWLRKNDHSRLRGGVSSMQLGKYENAFFPELFVVRAISNLKLCRFDDAKEDFGTFITYNKDWANKIEAALKTDKTPQPPSVDVYTRQIETAEAKRRAELATIKTIRENSVAAKTPAVGVQKHWKEAESSLFGQANRLEQNKLAEYRRIWRNQSVMLQEAIRKMKFVKVELLSQLAQGNTPKPDSEAARKSAEEVKTQVEQAGSGRFVYPFDGVAWPDEVFAARSTANNICL